MELTIYQTPPFIEELTFQVNPALLERYLELEYEIWTLELEKLPGFQGCEVWVSESCPGQVTSLYFWADRAAFEGIDPTWLAAQKERMNAAIGPENCTFVSAGHAVNARYKAREYR